MVFTLRQNRQPEVKPRMSISLFRTLIAISETGSFSAAANQVFVTHAAVGQQMKRLEDQLGVALFDRSEKSPRLNQLGKALVPKAREVVAAYDTILDDLTGDPALIGELILGAVPSTIRGLIPQVIKRLITAYPDLRVRVTPGLTPDLQDEVERGSVDAAVLSKPGASRPASQLGALCRGKGSSSSPPRRSRKAIRHGSLPPCRISGTRINPLLAFSPMIGSPRRRSK